SIAGSDEGGPVITTLLFALLNAAIALGALVLIGRRLLRPLFRHVAVSGTNDLFVAASLFVIVGTGVATAVAGLSMALGAFVAGLLLAETEFKKAIETTIEPFKGLLLGLFFFTVGMNIDFRELAREPVWLFASVVALIAVKFVILVGLARMFRVSWPAAIEAGLLLGPGGEFAFVAIGMATTYGLIKADVSSFTLALTSITMALIPLLALAARRIAPKFRMRESLAPELAVPPHVEKDHAVVIGHGRVGEVVCALLDRHGRHYIAVDNDAGAVPELRRTGREVFYGDATNPEFLKSCAVMQAQAVIITVSSQKAIDEIVRQVRLLRSDIMIVSRARDATHASHLYMIGVSDAVPETIEASLQLSEASLMGLGVPAGLVIASIHEKRDEMRAELQRAAGRAGITKTHSIRSKASR
ncbi:MAG: cation:proton antiporter, partial [Microvirga sp.]